MIPLFMHLFIRSTNTLVPALLDFCSWVCIGRLANEVFSAFIHFLVYMGDRGYP